MTSSTEQRNSNTLNIDLMSTTEVLTAINAEDMKIAPAIALTIPQISKAVDIIVKALNNGGRMAYFGAVTSGRICFLDACDCAPTFGIREDTIQAYIAGGDASLKQALDKVEDSSELALADIKAFNPGTNDIVISVSASGNPQYVVSVLQEAKKRGATTIGISSNPEAKLKPFADVFINPILGQEAIAGSSRMKSGTAQKMILNMLSTAAMVKLGKTYQNMMVDVTISNKKLYNRACAIISEIAKVSIEEAQNYLEQSGLQVKTACVMAAKKIDKTSAEQLLNEKQGILRKVIS